MYIIIIILLWTVWKRLTRKSTIQRISLGLMSSFKSLLAIRCGCMVLKAEEKSMKRIRTNETWFFKMCICIVQKSECCVFSASVVTCMHTGTGVNGASWVGGGWYVQNTSLQEMSEQSDDNHLNKKDFVVSWIGQTTEVFQVKGTVFSFRDHVKNWLKTTESWEAHNFKSLPHNYVVRTNSFPGVKLNKKTKKCPQWSWHQSQNLQHHPPPFPVVLIWSGLVQFWSLECQISSKSNSVHLHALFVYHLACLNCLI